MSDAAGESEAGGARSGRSAAAVAWAASLVIRSIRRTARLRFHGDRELRRREREDERLILAFWHRHLLLMPYVYRGRRIAVLVSRSRDGELIARTVAHFGIDVARGSTSRGGAAGLRDLLRKARAGYDLAFTPDGPRGPVGIVQPGVIAAAAAIGWPVIPVALAASHCRRLASWDRFLVPLPGARVHFVCGPELRVERGEAPEVAAEELARRLDRAESEAERLAAARYAEEV